MTDITIPFEVLEVAAIELHKIVCEGPAYEGAELTWDDADEQTRDHFFREARAACLAMIKNWPGAEFQTDRATFQSGKLVATHPDRVILPLTQESGNE